MGESAADVYAREKHFSAATQERWRALAAPDRDALLGLAERLRLGENHFRDVLDLLEDIAARQQTTIESIVAGDAVQALFEHGGGRNETLKQLKDMLRRQRYPQLVAAEAALALLVKSLSLPSDVRINFPENLDGSAIVVTVCAETAEQLRVRVGALAAACMGKEIDEIFRRLEGAA